MPKLTVSQRRKAAYAALSPEALKAKRAVDRASYLRNREERIRKATERNKVLDETGRAAANASKSRWQKRNPRVGRMHSAARRARELKAMPAWARTEEIETAYALAIFMTELTGEQYDVDHHYPLKGRNVCGFHVEQNLRVIHHDENKRKGNRMPIPKNRTCGNLSITRQ